MESPESTRLGFGCAAIPGALTQREALTLLETAYACGIRHFDTARMYCAGTSEAVLGELARRLGTELIIVTKAGIAPTSRFTRALDKFGLAPRFLKHLGGRFAPAQIVASLETSLRKLRVDRVDALLLHEVRIDEIDDELKITLERLRAAGKIGAWGIATSIAESEAIIAAHPELCDIVQVPAAWLDHPRSIPPHAKLIVHSVLGPRLAAFITTLRGSERSARQFEKETGLSVDDPTAIGGLMLQAAMARNPGGVTLFSTSRPERVRLNAELLTADPDSAAIHCLERAMRPPDALRAVK